MSVSAKIKGKTMFSGRPVRIICPHGKEVVAWFDKKYDNMVCFIGSSPGFTCEALGDDWGLEKVVILEVL